MAHLSRAGVECPAPEPDRSGALFSMLNGKPASLVTRVDGEPMLEPDAAHCAAVGAALARLHLASATYRPRLTNRRGPSWWRQAARARAFVSAAGTERDAHRGVEVPHRLRQGADAARRDSRRSLL
jgi:Ser/Thr protein kinase RdoA (MazF antagonist)